MKQVCVIGNSHAACLKLAWDQLESRFPTIGLTFFAIRKAGMKELQPAPGGVLVPMSQRLSKALMYTSGGRSVIDLKCYDAVLLVGLSAAYPKHGYYTRAVARQAMLDLIPTTLAFEMVQKIRKVSDIPIFLSHQPLRTDGLDRDDDRDVIAAKARFKGVAAYRGIVRAINEQIFSGLSARLLEQPIQTITKSFYTRSEYGVGSVRLDLGDGQEEGEDDRAHMNARFGDVYLSTHLRAIAYR